jgi:hypothetical protein
MTLSDAFSALALAGCRIKVEAGGSVILDVPPGRPAVPNAVLQALAAHRETLVAVLAPASPPAGAERQPAASVPKTSTGRPSPYAAENLARRSAPAPAAPPRPKLDAQAILARARAKAAAMWLNSRESNPASPPSPPADAPAPAGEDDIPF